MRSLAPYTCVILRGSYRSRGHNSTSVLLSRVITTNTERLYLYYPPSPQLVDIPSTN